MRLLPALFLALFLQPFLCGASSSHRLVIPLHAERSSPGDLEIGGELAGIPFGSTRFLRYDELLKFPQETITVTDDTFRTPTEITGISLSVLAKALGRHANMIVAICYDSYRSNYSPEYLDAHDPVLVLKVNGQTRDHWPTAPNGDQLTPYVIAHPHFVPRFKVLAHNDEEQIPYGVVRIEFRNSDHIYAPILPAAKWRGDEQIWNGYLIAREDCFRCHNSGAEGGTMGGRSWQLLGQDSVKDPERFRTIIHSPTTLRPGARMPAEAAYDRATLDALVAYFRTFAPAKPIPDPGVKEPVVKAPVVMPEVPKPEVTKPDVK